MPEIYQPQFLNVDIELRSHEAMDVILTSLGESIIVLHSSDAHVAFELSYSFDDVSDLAEHLASLLDSLPPQARQAWNGCYSRVFDIGLQFSDQTRPVEYEVPEKVVMLIAKAGFGLRITAYFS